MRIWHYKMLRYLPEHQFKALNRDIVLLMEQIATEGEPRLEVSTSRVLLSPKEDVKKYAYLYMMAYKERFGKYPKRLLERYSYIKPEPDEEIFVGWHNKEYLRVCMANLYEKWKFGMGGNKIHTSEWKSLANGYYFLTGERYQI